MQRLFLPIIAMMVVVMSSNYLVTIPINEWLTWGALTYPVAFLVTDLTNRVYGPVLARRVVYVGFACAVAASAVLMEPRIAIASGAAFIIGQLLDIFVFCRLLRMKWWKPPFIASALGSFIDTCIFFSIAFVGTDVPWITLGIGDFGVKIALALVFLAPFRVFIVFCEQRVRV